MARRPAVGGEIAFLTDPTLDAAPGLSPSQTEALRQAHEALVANGAVEEARRAALRALTAAPGLDAARVLAAQADFVAGDFAAVLDGLEALLEARPGHLPGQLVRGRAAEKLERTVLAFASYAEVADRSEPARVRAAALRPRALDILSRRVADAVARRRTDLAASSLAMLERFAPDELMTLEAALEVAAGAGDEVAELEAARRLVERRPGDRALSERRARLELAAGDVGQALRIYQELAATYPGEPAIAEGLESAKFFWRLNLLPAEVQGLVDRPVLDRGEYAALVYWLFPGVRYGRSETATIANDVLDHPHRQEIVRVVNLGLMRVDPDLHRFSPDRQLDRGDALATVLRLLAAERPAPACLEAAGAEAAAAMPAVCRRALACGLIAAAGECLAEAPVSGRAAVELARRALSRLPG